MLEKVTSYFKGLKYVWPFKSKLTATDQAENYTQPLIEFLGPWESSMFTIQSILIWEKPVKSAFALFAANLIYWYFALNNIQFFYGVNIFGLIVFIYHHWIYYIWPEICIPSVQDQEDWTPIHPRVLSVPEVGRYVEEGLCYLYEQNCRLFYLRKKQPGVFCMCTTFWFIMLGLLGQSISGIKLIYILLMFVMCAPGFLIHIVPKSVYAQLSNAWSILTGKGLMVDSTSNIENEMAEFLPESSSEDAQIALIIPLTSDHELESRQTIKQPKSKLRNRRSTSVRKSNMSGLTSFTSGLSDFPSLGDISNSEEEEYDLSLSSTIPEKSSSQDMEFVHTHFGDSSTDEEEEEFTEGLIFRDSSDGRRVILSKPNPPIPPPLTTQAVVDKLMGAVGAEHAASLFTSLGQQLVSAMRTNLPEDNARMTLQTKSSTDDGDEEFELISDDEL